MFEIIGYITVSMMVSVLLMIQYFIIIPHPSYDRTNTVERLIGLIPLVPFVMMIVMLMYFIVELLIVKFVKWFEINFGWFFINGRKRAAWAEHLRKKYEKENDV